MIYKRKHLFASHEPQIFLGQIYICIPNPINVPFKTTLLTTNPQTNCFLSETSVFLFTAIYFGKNSEKTIYEFEFRAFLQGWVDPYLICTAQKQTVLIKNIIIFYLFWLKNIEKLISEFKFRAFLPLQGRISTLHIIFIVFNK